MDTASYLLIAVIFLGVIAGIVCLINLPLAVLICIVICALFTIHAFVDRGGYQNF